MAVCLATLKAMSFYLLHNVSTLNQCRKLSFGTVVCKHFASYQGYPNYRWDLIFSLPGAMEAILEEECLRERKLREYEEGRAEVTRTLLSQSVLFDGLYSVVSLSSVLLLIRVCITSFARFLMRPATCFTDRSIHIQMTSIVSTANTNCDQSGHCMLQTVQFVISCFGLNTNEFHINIINSSKLR
jgi:hypothetical protein